mmetsp:Transcript_29591/g.83465  ORF Transcript_29591/g.83465 Transcript_29591/m.83465 type:complete len:202 (-) Transcript_29591:404-1009(-)
MATAPSALTLCRRQRQHGAEGAGSLAAGCTPASHTRAYCATRASFRTWWRWPAGAMPPPTPPGMEGQLQQQGNPSAVFMSSQDPESAPPFRQPTQRRHSLLPARLHAALGSGAEDRDPGREPGILPYLSFTRVPAPGEHRSPAAGSRASRPACACVHTFLQQGNPKHSTPLSLPPRHRLNRHWKAPPLLQRWNVKGLWFSP